MPGLGRLVPSDWKHVEKHPLKAAGLRKAISVDLVIPIPENLNASYIRERYNQGYEGACTGYSWSWAMTLLNKTVYDSRWLYREAQLIDEFISTPPEEGSSVRAAAEVLRTKGHKAFNSNTGIYEPPNVLEGIAHCRWAHDVDDIRTAIFNELPCVAGINWYEYFTKPSPYVSEVPDEYWIGNGDYWGEIAGGHAICLCGASDIREAFLLRNSWGVDYPDVWISYRNMERLLLKEEGEVGIPTDR